MRKQKSKEYSMAERAKAKCLAYNKKKPVARS